MRTRRAERRSRCTWLCKTCYLCVCVCVCVAQLGEWLRCGESKLSEIESARVLLGAWDSRVFKRAAYTRGCRHDDRHCEALRGCKRKDTEKSTEAENSVRRESNVRVRAAHTKQKHGHINAVRQRNRSGMCEKRVWRLTKGEQPLDHLPLSPLLPVDAALEIQR